MKRPNYNQIYYDLIKAKFPDTLDKYRSVLEKKKELSVLEIVRLNESIFGRPNPESHHNQKYKSYDKRTIFEILAYQKEYGLNNSQLALHFRLSRNTVASWKKKFFSNSKKKK